MQACPKCNYVRRVSDRNPEWQCPACGVAYNKINNEAAGRITPLVKQREASSAKLHLFSKPFKLPIILITLIAVFVLFKLLSGSMLWSSKKKIAMPAFSTGVQINDPVIKTFPISGSNFSELDAAVRQAGPLDSDGSRRWWGMTHWNIRWEFAHATEKNRCRLDRFALVLDGVIELPDFVNRSSATEEMKTKWDSFIAALRTHEYGHWKNGIDAVNDLEKRLLQIPPKPNCDALDQEIDIVGAQLMQEYREADKQYDHVTNHGINRGATW